MTFVVMESRLSLFSLFPTHEYSPTEAEQWKYNYYNCLSVIKKVYLLELVLPKKEEDKLNWTR